MSGLNGVSTAADDVEAYLRVENLSKIYATRDGQVRALDEISFTQRRGEFLSHVGPSGCGKSTLLMIAAGLIAPTSGAVRAGGRGVNRPRTDIGIVFQNPVLLEWRTALGNIMLQAEARKMERKDAESRARKLLAAVGLGGFEDKYPHELSGGMRQRVSICRALIHNPDHLLMDEPFGALDAQTRGLMQENLLRRWDEIGATVLFVTHDVDEALYLADRVVVMSAAPGRVLLNLEIELPRPRPDDVFALPAFAEAKRQCLRLIRQESQRAFDIQRGSLQ